MKKRWKWKSLKSSLKRLPDALKRTKSYWALALVLVGLTIVTLDWLSNRTSKDSTTGTISGTKDPWSYFHPTWLEPSWLVRIVKSDEKLQNSARTVRDLVVDPEDRIEDVFNVPPGLKTRTTFWMEIYSRYNSRMRVVHDRNDPGIIYGYMDFRPLYRELGAGLDTEIKINALEKQIISTLKKQLLNAEQDNRVAGFLSQLGLIQPGDVADAVGRIRTQTGQADNFLAALYRSRQLLPHIETIFRRQNLPVGLGRIPFVESSFNPSALSSDGAMGIWQFMPATAKQMIPGKDKKSWADPLKQTVSAARLLRIYRSLLPDWGSTVTAYNSGVGRVRRLVEKNRLKGIEDLLVVEDEDGLGFAGKNFYAEFLAANLVEAYKEVLFEKALEPQDFSLVFKGKEPFPKEFCDL